VQVRGRQERPVRGPLYLRHRLLASQKCLPPTARRRRRRVVVVCSVAIVVVVEASRKHFKSTLLETIPPAGSALYLHRLPLTYSPPLAALLLLYLLTRTGTTPAHAVRLFSSPRKPLFLSPANISTFERVLTRGTTTQTEHLLPNTPAAISVCRSDAARQRAETVLADHEFLLPHGPTLSSTRPPAATSIPPHLAVYTLTLPIPLLPPLAHKRTHEPSHHSCRNLSSCAACHGIPRRRRERQPSSHRPDTIDTHGGPRVERAHQ
jgi:hypothetical protein